MLKRCLHIGFWILVVWAAGFAVYAERVVRAKPYGGAADAAIILTGGDGRVEAGLRLLARGRVARVLVSGAHPDVTVNDLLVLYGFEAALADKIDLGFAARDTVGNATEAAAWVEKNKITSVIIVTAHYHIPRAMMNMSVLLPNVTLHPYGIRPRVFRARAQGALTGRLRYLIIEYHKMLAAYPNLVWRGMMG